MKKLLFAIAGAASFAALAADPAARSGDISLVGFENYTADQTVIGYGDDGNSGSTLWSATGDDASLVKTYGGDNATAPSITEPAPFDVAIDPNTKYLALDTNGSELRRAVGTTVAATGTYIDTLVQFTPSESDPNSADLTGAKLAIWLKADSEHNTTNLYVQGNSWDIAEGFQGTSQAFALSGKTIEPGTWYRLTVKAIPNILGDDTGSCIPAFQISVDGTEMTLAASPFSADMLTTLAEYGSAAYASADIQTAFAANKLVPAIQTEIGTAGDTLTLTSVGFKGTGALDDFVVTTETPVPGPATIDFTLTWPNGYTPVSYQIGDGEAVSLTGESSPFSVPGLAAGDVVKFIVANADGAQKTLTGTAGTDTGLDATGQTFGWPEYLGEAVAGAYEIDDADELVLFQKGVAAGLTTASTTFKLTDDVTLTAPWPGVGLQNGKDLWSPANGTPAADVDIATNNYINGAFKGTFDGQNHTISGFQMQGGGLDYCGFFNSIYGATICNLKIAYAAALFAPDTTGSSAESGGTFVGVTGANSTLRNLTTAAGTVSCSKGFGGIVGYLSDGSLVEYCTNNVNLTSLQPNKCGGIAMIVQRGAAVTVRNCQNNGTTTGNESQQGGIVGYVGVATTIENCEDTAGSTPSILHNHGQTVTISGVNKAPAGVASYTTSNNNPIDGLDFATVDGTVATFVKSADMELSGTYKVMGPKAAYEFAAAGSITFDESLATPTVTAATGFKVTQAGEGTVTYTAAALATPTVTVTGGANATAVWTVNDEVVAAAPATLTEGDTYSVAYTANQGYEFAENAVTNASGTAGTENIVITIADATKVGGAEFDTDADDLLDAETTVTADDVASYVASVTGEAAPAVVTKPMVVSYLLNANKILTTPVTEVLKITAIEQVTGGWKITVAAALNADDVAAGATVNLNNITGALKVTATADLGTAFAPVAQSAFSVSEGANGAATITVTDANAKFLKATVTK